MDLVDRIMVSISATSAGAVQELDKLQKESSKTDKAFDSLGKQAGISGQAIKAGLVAGAVAFIGTGLVTYLQDSVDAFGDSAKAAGELATATGGTVESVSRMQAALEDSGISAETSAGLITKFTVNAGKQKQLLDELGVTLTKNADGSVDYADAMVQTVDKINQMGDASAKNKALVDLFGKTGAQAFQELAASGVSLSDAMRAVSKYRVFTAEDVRAAAAYDDAMDELGASAQGLQFTMGRALIPAVTTLTNVLGGLLDAASPVLAVMVSLPSEVYLVAAAALALNVAIKSGLASSLASMAAQYTTGFALLRTEMSLTAAAATATSNALKAAFLSNPVGWVLLAVTAAFTAVSAANANFNKQVEGSVPRLKELERQGKSTADALKQTADELEASSNAAENWWAAMSDANPVDWAARLVNPFRLGADSLRAFIDAMREGGADADHYADELAKLADEQGAMAAITADAQVQQKSLNDLLAEGGYSASELADAVRNTADAQHEQNQVTDQAKALMDAYAASTYEAVDATLALFDKTFAARDAQRDYNEAIRQFNEGGFENTDERAAGLDDIAQAALRSAAAPAEAQRQTDLLNGVTRDAAYYNDLMIESLKTLAAQEGLPPEAKAALDGYIGSLETAQAKAGEGVSTTATLTVTGADEAEATITGAAADQDTTVTISTQFSPDGYNAVKARKDYLATQVNASMVINTEFGPDGYLNVKARKDYLSQDRTAYIDVVVRGLSTARAQLNSLAPAALSPAPSAGQHTTTSPANVTQHWSVTVNGARSPEATVRAIERWARDNGRPEKVVVTL